MRKLLGALMLSGAVIAQSASAAYAQSYQDFRQRPAALGEQRADSVAAPYATAGATIYVCDANGRLWTVTLGTYKLHLVGSLGVVLTDIAFNPKDGKLWGVDFSTFYTINTTTGRATGFGRTSLSDINALVFNTNGIGYFEGFSSSELYEVDVVKGKYAGIGTTGSYKSADDLSWYNGELVLSGFTGTLSSSTKETIVKVSSTNGKVLATAPTSVANLYGLSTVGGKTLYGFANSRLYLVTPSAKTVAARTKLLKNFQSEGLGKVNGAAYKSDT